MMSQPNKEDQKQTQMESSKIQTHFRFEQDSFIQDSILQGHFQLRLGVCMEFPDRFFEPHLG